MTRKQISALTYDQFLARFRGLSYFTQVRLQGEAGFSIAYDDWQAMRRAKAIALGLDPDASTELVIYYALGGKDGIAAVGKPSIRLEFATNEDLLTFQERMATVEVDTIPTKALPRYDDETKPRRTRKQAATPPAQAYAGVELLPIDDVHEARGLFQNRAEAFSSESVERILADVEAGQFRWAMFDPITVWRNPEDGRYYILSGHSRTEAFRRLAAQGATAEGRTFDQIPVKVADVDLEEAKRLARTSNNLSTKETDTERAAYYRAKLEEGTPKKEVEAEAKKLEGRNANYILNLAALAPTSQAFTLAQAMEGAAESQNAVLARALADWIGEGVRRFKLTRAQQDEAHAYLSRQYGKAYTSKGQWLERLDNVITKQRLLGEEGQALNLENRTMKSVDEMDWDATLEDLRQQLKEAEKNLKTAREGLIRNGYSGEKLDHYLSEHEGRIRAISRKIVEHMDTKGAMREAARSQLAIFGLNRLEDFVAKALARKEGNKLYLDLGPVNEELIDAFKKYWQRDVKDFTLVFDESSVRHIHKEHGNPEAEISRGNMPFTFKDYLALPKAINNSLVILPGDDLSKVQIISESEGYLYIILVERAQRKKLAINTAYKKKTRPR